MSTVSNLSCPCTRFDDATSLMDPAVVTLAAEFEVTRQSEQILQNAHLRCHPLDAHQDHDYFLYRPFPLHTGAPTADGV